MPAWIEHTLQDLRYALRGLRRNPAFALTALLAAAIAIGATTAVFSVVDRILFRSLPYRDEARLVSAGIMAPLDAVEGSRPLKGADRKLAISARALEALDTWLAGRHVTAVPDVGALAGIMG